jgi:hypothetical protein
MTTHDSCNCSKRSNRCGITNVELISPSWCSDQIGNKGLLWGVAFRREGVQVSILAQQHLALSSLLIWRWVPELLKPVGWRSNRQFCIYSIDRLDDSPGSNKDWHVKTYGTFPSPSNSINSNSLEISSRSSFSFCRGPLDRQSRTSNTISTNLLQL